jgi:hypothetical protein
MSKSGKWTRDLGWSLIISPSIAFMILLYAAIDEPSFILEYPWLYLFALGVPYALGIILLIISKSDDRSSTKS